MATADELDLVALAPRVVERFDAARAVGGVRHLPQRPRDEVPKYVPQ
jgi:hypothetical protein